LIDVAVIPKFAAAKGRGRLVAEYGHVIVMNVTIFQQLTFERVLREVKAKYVLGLTATRLEKDGHQPIIYMQCGPIRFHLSREEGCRVFTPRAQVFQGLTDFGLESA